MMQGLPLENSVDKVHNLLSTRRQEKEEMKKKNRRKELGFRLDYVRFKYVPSARPVDHESRTIFSP